MDGEGNGVDTAAEETDAPAPAKKAKSKPKAKAAKPAAKKAKAAAKPVKGKAKRRDINPDLVDAYGFRKGTIKSKAAAMYARKDGATLAEVKKALGSVQYNVIKQLEEKGFKIRRSEVDNRATGRTATKFMLAAK